MSAGGCSERATARADRRDSQTEVGIGTLTRSSVPFLFSTETTYLATVSPANMKPVARPTRIRPRACNLGLRKYTSIHRGHFNPPWDDCRDDD